MGFLPGFHPPDPTVAADGAGGDEWYTPAFLLDWIGDIALDPCWAPDSRVRANAVIDVRTGGDGLRDDWRPTGDGVIFVNPPFSNCGAWLRHADVWSRHLRRVVVALVPAIPGDGPWRHVWASAHIVGFIAGRVHFTNPDGVIESKGRGHALVIFGELDAAVEVARQIAERSLGHAQAPTFVLRLK